MRKVLFFMLALNLIFFSCKSAPEQEKAPVVEEPIVEEPVVEHASNVFVINCPADMKKVDVLMASKLDEIAEIIKTTKPETVTFAGYTAKLNTEREEELASKSAVRSIVKYLENTDALDYVNVIVENKGASEPVASHNDIAARGENRRVVITLK